MWLDLQELTTAWTWLPPALAAIAPPVAPRLSDAMRRGLEICPNDLRGQWIDLSESAACAVGTIFAGAGLDFNHTAVYGGLQKMYPQVCNPVQMPPAAGNYAVSLFMAINNLYEHHGWTRQQILDWLIEEGY